MTAIEAAAQVAANIVALNEGRITVEAARAENERLRRPFTAAEWTQAKFMAVASMQRQGRVR